MENRFYIYIILDPRKPGKYTYGDYSFDYEPFYVGKGQKYRMYEHLYEKIDTTTNKYKFRIIQKILKNKLEPIFLKVINGIENSEAIKFEIDLIKLIGRKLNGGVLTNLTDGGEGCLGRKHTDESKNLISLKNSGKNSHFFNKPAINRKIVLRFDKNGNFIDEWSSIRNASENLKINPTHICNVCQNKRLSAGGYIWKYKNDSNEITKYCRIPKNAIRIAQYNKDNELLNIFNSIADAMRYTGIHQNTISNNLRGIKKSRKYIWKYLD